MTEYLRQYAMATGFDPEIITGVHLDPNADMARLRVSDLKDLLHQIQVLTRIAAAKHFPDIPDEETLTFREPNLPLGTVIRDAAGKFWQWEVQGDHHAWFSWHTGEPTNKKNRPLVFPLRIQS